jgi:hypothetical protein
MHRFYLQRFESWLLSKEPDEKDLAEFEKEVAFDLMMTALGLEIEAH